MKKLFLSIILILSFSSNLSAEYRVEPVNCTLKKQANCGAYLYNIKTGATYYCNSESCKEVMEAMEEVVAVEGSKDSNKSKIPKKKEKKKSKIPKFKKN